jgi:cytochrome c oxidase subunit 3
MLFSGLFIWYGVYTSSYATEFHHAAKELNVLLGAFNTLLLLTSSLTVALSITAIMRNEVKRCIGLLILSLLMGSGFLVIKYFEWSAKFSHGIYPGGAHWGMEDKSALFFSIYYGITGLHGIHVIIGLIVLSIATYRVAIGMTNKDDFAWLENAGLYWHLVDVIWIYVFPLIYLVS